MFNAVCKIPMQFFILLLGAMLFVFYLFAQPPLYFNQSAWKAAMAQDKNGQLRAFDAEFAQLHEQRRQALDRWIDARHRGDHDAEESARTQATALSQRCEKIRSDAKAASLGTKANDADYVFISFILAELPHGMIGLLVAAFFAAALSSKAAELNALGSTTTVDFYRHVFKPAATDAHYVAASRAFTLFWGIVAIAFALFANLVENLIQAVNIVGSVFYGVVLALFLVAFFLRRIGGTAVFWAAIVAQLLVFALYFSLNISYLWYNLIGCVACIGIAALLQLALGQPAEQVGFPVVMSPPGQSDQ